jgi:RNA polymerase sigma-70 factor (ECF subfamily)
MKSYEAPEPLESFVQRLRDDAGHEESFRALFDRFYGPLFRFFQKRGFSTEESQDLIQETFLRVYVGIADFRGESRGVHWLFRIAANTALKAVRHRTAAKRAGESVPLDGEEAGSEGSAPLRQLLDKERKERLAEAIERLPAQMRRCVRLRVLQDLDYGEIAEILQISPSTVKVQLFKARKRLQMELGDSLGGLDL